MVLAKRFQVAVALLLTLIVLSVGGYRLLGGPSVTFLQAIYMAVITLAGVGYGEIVDTSHNPALRVFNMGVVIFGVAITVYVFSVVAAFLVEVDLTNPFWRRRMQRHINDLSDHYVVCGLGDTGRHAVVELQKTKTPHVVIDVSEENVNRLKEVHTDVLGEMLYVVGDATEEDVLEKAGMDRARGLIAALPLDKDNLVITVIVRQRFPRVRIVARSAELKFADRMLRAGANATVSPSRARQDSARGRDRSKTIFALVGECIARPQSERTLQPSRSGLETSSRGKCHGVGSQSARQRHGRPPGHHHRHGGREGHPARPR